MSKYQKVLAHISYWLSLVDEIDPEVFEWIRISTKYIRESDEIFFTEYLLNHVAKTPEFVGKIFYEVVKEQKYFLKYKKNQIIEIMEKLYELNQTEIAKRICNLYLDGGYDFLRKTCEKHNLK